MSASLDIRDLNLSLNGASILRGVSFSAEAGRITALVGESGSGKSMTLRAVMGLAPARACIDGSAVLGGENLLAAAESHLRSVRGARIGMVFQEVMTALNPVRTIGAQVVEAIRAHRPADAKTAAETARAVLDRVGLAKIGAERYPHQLSGGQRQRVAIAMAIALKPAILLADEPTTALDVTTQAQVLDLLQRLVREDGMALVLVTHDLALVSNYADKIAIMQKGEIVETTHGSLRDLKHPYSRALLLAAASAPRRALRAASDEALLRVEDVGVHYRGAQAPALSGVSCVVRRGETLGVVGESGSGKSTLGRIVLGLQTPKRGQILIGGVSLGDAKRTALKTLRRQVQIVFQDPAGSFDPRQTIERVIAEPLHLNENKLSRDGRRALVEQALREVGLNASDADRYPHEFSGGQRQRVAIARALIAEPALIVLDEAVSALDVSVRAQILALLADIADRRNVSYLFISHDLEIVRGMTDRVIVLKNGRIVEEGATTEIFAAPKHPYTQSLLAATPRLERDTIKPGQFDR